MKIIKGNSRIVIIFRFFVVKFPRVRSRSGFRTLYSHLKKGCLLKHLKEYNHEYYGSVRRFFFNGIISNWVEFVFYRENKHLLLLAPVYLSFFGLLNVQKYYKPIEINEVNLWCQFIDLTDVGIFKHSHTFGNPKNFGYDNGKLKILDYGSKRVQEFLIEYSEIIYSGFKFSYSRFERLEQIEAKIRKKK